MRLPTYIFQKINKQITRFHDQKKETTLINEKSIQICQSLL